MLAVYSGTEQESGVAGRGVSTHPRRPLASPTADAYPVKRALSPVRPFIRCSRLRIFRARTNTPGWDGVAAGGDGYFYSAAAARPSSDGHRGHRRRIQGELQRRRPAGH